MELFVPEEELEEFPEPPPFKANEIKYSFLDKINFNIPKGIKGSKPCIKHHSILCKVCPLSRRAHKYRQQSVKISVRTFIQEDNPTVSDGNPKIHLNNPPTNAGNPPQLLSEAASEKFISTTPVHEDNLAVSDDDLNIHLNNPPIHKGIESPDTPAPQCSIPAPQPTSEAPEISYKCTFCGCCTCLQEKCNVGIQTKQPSYKQWRKYTPALIHGAPSFRAPQRPLLTPLPQIPSLLTLSLRPPLKWKPHEWLLLLVEDWEEVAHPHLSVTLDHLYHLLQVLLQLLYQALVPHLWAQVPHL